MSLDKGVEWTPRQKMGLEYFQYSDKLPMEVNGIREDKSWKLEFQAKSKIPPEVDRLSPQVGPFVIFYDVDSFIVTNKKHSNQLDLASIIPINWSLKHIKLTSPNYMAPEVHQLISDHELIDPVNQEIVIGELLESESFDPETILKICLWDTLVARFLAEIGDPANEESAKTMSQVLLERRELVLDALSKDTKNDPVTIAKKPFS